MTKQLQKAAHLLSRKNHILAFYSIMAKTKGLIECKMASNNLDANEPVYEFEKMLKPSLTEQATQEILKTLYLHELKRSHISLAVPGPPEADPEASTLFGKALQLGWDKVSGQTKIIEEKSTRAAKSDQYAEITADTIAALPKVGPLVGGVTRAILLADVSNKSLQSSSQKFALDLLQGATLNRVASKVHSSAKTSTDRAATSGTQLTKYFYNGAAFGGVKTAFNSDTYYDANNNLSAISATHNLSSGIFTGGLISVPAGFIGSRVAQNLATLANNTERSLTLSVLSSTATQASSSFANGAVFGGVEAARQSFTLNNVIGGALEGGAIGVLTGGIASSTGKIRFGNTPKSEQTATKLSATASSSDENFSDYSTPTTTKVTRIKLPESLRINLMASSLTSKPNENTLDLKTKPELLPEQTLIDLLFSKASKVGYGAMSFKPLGKARLTEAESKLEKLPSIVRNEYTLPDNLSTSHEDIVTMIENRAKPGYKPTPSDPFENLNYRPVELRVYEIKGRKAKITIAEDYAKQLDEVKNLRLRVEKAQSKEEAAAAARKLSEHPMSAKALPEDIAQLLEQLPQSNLIAEVEISGKTGVSDLYSRYKYGDKNFSAAAHVNEDGKVTLRQPDIDSTLTTYLAHEISHLTKWASKGTGELFDRATAVDLVEANVNHKETRLAKQAMPETDEVINPGIYHPSEHASRNLDEGWAVAMGENLMHPDASRMAIYARKAPVRTLVLSQALANDASQAIATGNSPVAPLLIERAQLLDKAVRPVALKILQERIVSGDTQQKIDALELIGAYGTAKEHSAILLKAALEPLNGKLPEAGIGNIQLDAITPAQAAFEAMIKLHSDEPSIKLEFAKKIANENQELRSLAAPIINRLEVLLYFQNRG